MLLSMDDLYLLYAGMRVLNNNFYTTIVLIMS